MRRFLRIEDMEAVKPFDCGDATLNSFLVDDARYFYDEFIANTVPMYFDLKAFLEKS